MPRLASAPDRRRGWAAILLVTGLVSGCSGADSSGSSADPGSPRAASSTASRLVSTPEVIAHRGASGYRPEHTIAAYELAVQQGADAIEPDLVLTRDGVLVDRHEPEISSTTDVADHPEFSDRRREMTIDGERVTGWFVQDFTLAELRTLRARERLPEVRPANTAYDGRWTVPTFDEVLDLRERLSRSSGRSIDVVPEIKHPTWFRSLGKDPEEALVRVLKRHGLTSATAPVLVQCFEPTSLHRLRAKGYRGRTLLLVSKGAPYDLVAAGDTRTYADLLTPGSLRDLRPDVDALGPDKGLVVPVVDGRPTTPTPLVARAHAAGMEVIPYTFRAENRFLPAADQRGKDPAARGDLAAELEVYFRAGVDGVFCDQPDLCLEARAALPTRR